VQLAALAATVALVVQSQASLRAAPHENAPRQTLLTPGDWLEVRGEQQGYLQVYDHRRERPGYVRPVVVRSYVVDEAVAPKLGAVIDYLKNAPGEESLGIGYVALYLRAAPAQAIGADVFDALGTMAERLGRRASVRVAKAGEASIASELEVAESYGVHFISFEREGATRVCYDGEAFRRVLALRDTGPARVRAALGLSDPTCLDPALGSSAALALARSWGSVLDEIDLGAMGPEVPASARAGVRLRRSIVQSEISYFAARSADGALAKQAAEAAKYELELADPSVLADEDRPTYEEAAMRVATVRWAVETPPSPDASSGIDVEIATGLPGQTCVRLKRRASREAPPFEHCTHGVVWRSSLRVAPHDAAVAMIVEPLDGWSELLLFHPGAAGWEADTVTPASIDPELGYVDVSGFSPDGAHLRVVREYRASGPLGAPHTLAPWIRKTFQILATRDLRVEKEASSLASLPAWNRLR
jgi:hypothetical protein